MSLEREVRKFERQLKSDSAKMTRELQNLENGLQVVTAIDKGQLVLAISLGITLSKIEDGITLAEKISAADQAGDTPPNTMQKALLQLLQWPAPSATATRGEVSYEIIRKLNGDHKTFFQSLDAAFQERFCGGPLKRLNLSSVSLQTLKTVGSIFGLMWTLFKAAFVIVVGMLVIGILIAIFAPKKNDTSDSGVSAPQSELKGVNQ